MYAKEKIKQERSVGVNKFWSRVTTKKYLVIIQKACRHITMGDGA